MKKYVLHFGILHGLVWTLYFVTALTGGLRISGTSVIRQIVIQGIFTLALALELMIGNLDLSIVSQTAISTVLLAKLVSAGAGWGAALLVTLLFHLAVGMIKGIVQSKLSVNPILFGLALQVIFKNLWASENNVIIEHHFLQNHAWVLASIGVFFLLFLLLIEIVMQNTCFGTYCYILGEAPELVKQSCGNSLSVSVAVHLLSSLLLFTAMVMLVTMTGAGSTALSSLFLYKAIAGCCVGGVWYRSEKFLSLRVLAGTVAIIMLEQLMVCCGIYTQFHMMFLGIVILAEIYLGESRSQNNRKTSG